VRNRVPAAATLIWLPEPVVAVAGCRHLNDVRVEVDQGARFFMREEILLGRHGEPPGQVTQTVSVRHAGRPLYRQDLAVGTVGADSPAVIGHHRAVGSAVVVDPGWGEHPPAAQPLIGDSALLPLTGPGAVITALAEDNLELRAQLQAGLTALGPPWDPVRTDR
jgi:urease accessory protein